MDPARAHSGLSDSRYAADPRRGPVRSRRGRGPRGPLVLPGPLAPAGVPLSRSPREAFDSTVLAAIERLRTRFAAELDLVEFGVEDVPLLPDGWQGDRVPLASVVHPDGSEPPRVVIFRLPVTGRCSDQRELEGLVFTLVVQQLADLWDRDVEDIDPR